MAIALKNAKAAAEWADHDAVVPSAVEGILDDIEERGVPHGAAVEPLAEPAGGEGA
ncbi:MAG: hypothetical protein ACFCBW_10965 [Candidatus Competibacterales bacterium]